jgi:hypothetical protein
VDIKDAFQRTNNEAGCEMQVLCAEIRKGDDTGAHTVVRAMSSCAWRGDCRSAGHKPGPAACVNIQPLFLMENKTRRPLFGWHPPTYGYLTYLNQRHELSLPGRRPSSAELGQAAQRPSSARQTNGRARPCTIPVSGVPV